MSLAINHRLLTPTLSTQTPRPTVSHHTFLFTCGELGLHFLLQRQEVEQGTSLLHKAYFKGLPAPHASGKYRREQPAVAHLGPWGTLRKALPLSRETRVLAGAPRLYGGGSAPGSPPLGAWRRKRRPALSAGGWRQRLRWPVPCLEPERNSPFPARPANLPEEKCDCSRCHQQRQECVSQSVCLSALRSSFSLSTPVCPCL